MNTFGFKNDPDEHEPELLKKHERQPHEPYDDFSRRTRKGQCVKALMACFGIHAALTIAIATLLIVFSHDEKFIFRIGLGYVALGWLPLIKAYPLFMRKLD